MLHLDAKSQMHKSRLGENKVNSMEDWGDSDQNEPTQGRGWTKWRGPCSRSDRRWDSEGVEGLIQTNERKGIGIYLKEENYERRSACLKV